MLDKPSNDYNYHPKTLPPLELSKIRTCYPSLLPATLLPLLHPFPISPLLLHSVSILLFLCLSTPLSSSPHLRQSPRFHATPSRSIPPNPSPFQPTSCERATI
ncbi:hypothetical protein BU26DRAFT_514604 [Trematosphaeria pertusa]|uniref:Uncharacterized protein n=1 Tax=Trematosphaeria pertusa TaxID=390896 RepID=A0A6A6IYP3_9PLEO|nr:uncharacterized protein BU26DRAFT_514604 [Trematosphaeria pertusa]KAF2254740.1 hypothetical protein BU26DRAFT_514604 [Trematosphaeria pertusa]